MHLIIIYISAIVIANQLVFMIGPWWSIVNSIILIGLDFILRDVIHEKIGFKKVMMLSITAGFISYSINQDVGSIAIASSISFLIASTGDAATYQIMIKKDWLIKSNSSNVIASGFDSIAFPLIAFGAFMPDIMIGQFVAKVLGGFCWSFVIARFK